MPGETLLAGKTALITGTGRGIGKAVAEQFAKHGAVVYRAARSEGSVDEHSAMLSERYGTQVIPLYFDVTDRDAAKEAVMRIKKESGRLDILVNNAGVMSNQLMSFITRDTMQKLFEVNVFAVIELMQLASKIMTRQKSGSIINISSIVAQRGSAGQLAYSASKGAVISLTKTAAKELAPYNIRVNSVAPGLTDTDALKETEEKNLEKRIENIGLGRIASPEDIANACVFLGSDLSSYISGEIIGVNGCAVM